MQANSKVELCAFDGKTWIRIAATAVRDENKKAKEHMLDVYPNLKAMYSVEDDNTEVLYLKDATATFSSFTEASREVKF